uniref:Uncharacterized protein n=1 Tax=Arundo donax TaxID=35708 RepID=A0A0A9FXT2_ARUDO
MEAGSFDNTEACAMIILQGGMDAIQGEYIDALT